MIFLNHKLDVLDDTKSRENLKNSLNELKMKQIKDDKKDTYDIMPFNVDFAIIVIKRPKMIKKEFEVIEATLIVGSEKISSKKTVLSKDQNYY